MQKGLKEGKVSKKAKVNIGQHLPLRLGTKTGRVLRPLQVKEFQHQTGHFWPATSAKLIGFRAHDLCEAHWYSGQSAHCMYPRDLAIICSQTRPLRYINSPAQTQPEARPPYHILPSLGSVAGGGLERFGPGGTVFASSSAVSREQTSDVPCSRVTPGS